MEAVHDIRALDGGRLARGVVRALRRAVERWIEQRERALRIRAVIYSHVESRADR